MQNTLNLYGDAKIPTASGHGVDIASQRADDLDLLAIEDIHRLKASARCPVLAIDIGCGFGGQSVRMAQAGAVVLAMDREDYSEQIALNAARAGVEVSFCQSLVADQPNIGFFDIIVCQRMIHYLPYREAVEALRWMHSIASNEGHLYLSASGMESELGTDYPGKSEPLDSRWATLSPLMAEKHGMHPPVCLYWLEEFPGVVRKAGWVVETVFASPFGNLKLMARKQ